MKKKLMFLFLMGVTSTQCFASGKSSDDETIFTIIYIVFGILYLILLYKIWCMTNDVASLKKKIVDHSHGEDVERQCRKLLLLGRKDEAKEIMIDVFFHELEKEFYKFHYDAFEFEKFKKKPIEPYLKRLERNLMGIDEKVPESIAKLTTIGDYFNLVKIEKSTMEQTDKIQPNPSGGLADYK